MSGGFFALLDDIAALAKIAAASVDDIGAAAGRASAKAAGVVVDDTAVTPQYLHGTAAERELPIIKRIAIGSLKNKVFIILPVALILSQFFPAGLPILMIVGGCYLGYEGAEKIWEKIGGHEESPEDEMDAQGDFTPEHEEKTVKAAIRTDLVLSAEIMVIALNEVVASTDAGFGGRAAILLVVAVAITILVYGAVALLVKMDDAGLHLAGKPSPASQKVGHGLVAAMPKVLSALSIIGIIAMLWVGGHILLMSMDQLGFHWLYSQVHHAEEWAHHLVPVGGGVLGWIVNSGLSGIFGLLVGAIIVAVMHVLPFGHGGGHGHGDEHGADHGAEDAGASPAADEATKREDGTG